jgi:L-amino acid N-acyltransferase YncA
MLTIRQATVEDAQAIWEIFRDIALQGETYAFPADIDREAALRIWLETPQRTFVAEQADRVVGTYYLKTNLPGRGSHVCNAGYMVREEARGQGVGGAMCDHSLDQARKLGYQAMQFNLVVSTNESAIRLWQDKGFIIAGRLPKAFDHARFGLVDAFVMYRLLP